MHEFAVRESFRRNLDGHIYLKTKANNSLENFLFGYRYREKDKLACTCGQSICGEMEDLITKYFEAKNNQNPVEEIVAKLENLEKNLKEHPNDFEFPEGREMSLAFFHIRREAEKVLKNVPQNMQEVIDHGVYFDKNKRLEKMVANNPMWHPKLGPLLENYFENFGKKGEAQKTLEEIKAPEFKDCIDAIYEEMDLVNYRTRDKQSLTRFLGYMYERRNNQIHYEGNMYLSDEFIEQWRKDLGDEIQ